MIKFYKEGIMKNIVPLMLCLTIVTSCMYVYSRALLPLYALITVLIQTTVFSFYTYISRKSMLLRFISILGSFLAIGALVLIAIQTGNNKSSIDYFIWFLSPQSLVDFSFAYISATFIIINFFIASTVYYFSAVRYRISMTFMITLIPFAVYRKEGEDVPVPFALLLLVMYMALMIHCRQSYEKKGQKMIVDRGYKRSMTLFLAFTALLAMALPKPDIGFDNSWVDAVFESEKISEYMMKRLGIMSETASSSAVYTKTKDIKLFEFTSDVVPINLKSQTFSRYDYDTNTWTAEKYETNGSKLEYSGADELNPEEFYRAVAAACSLDSEFAEKYGLEDIKPELKQSYTRKLNMIYTRVPSKFYFSPVLTYHASSDGGNEALISSNGTVFSSGTSGYTYSVTYYSDISLYEKDMNTLVNSLNMDNFGEFLDEMSDILDENEAEEFDTVWHAYNSDYRVALDYMDETVTAVPDSVMKIAEKTVAKCESDYEKAMAIEDYFLLNDFTYSTSYQKPAGYSMEYFLTEGKTGICSDYATAMVLMARAVGIPARYAEGIHLHDPDENGIIEVTDGDLHAFPELYISGFGWKSFEPTRLNNTDEKSSFDMKMSVVLGFSAFVLIVFILFSDKYIIPYFSEKIFRRRVRKVSEEKAVELIVSRLIKKLGLPESTTSAELGHYVKEVYETDISGTAAEFDRAVYGMEKISSGARIKALEQYTMIADFMSGKNKRR